MVHVENKEQIKLMKRLFVVLVMLFFRSSVVHCDEPIAVPSYRTKNDCGRMAAFCFGSIYKYVSFDEAFKIPLTDDGATGASVNPS